MSAPSRPARPASMYCRFILPRFTPSPTQVLGQRKRASAFAVLDANGVFEELRSLLAMAEEGRRRYLQAHRAQQAQQAQS